ncbi:MAG: hypothetical protein NDI94_02510 [Candidatus Woesearchaeota archaeon]|nr:hypothetical protein [Candidatus Woesearchaeota archaeon]
MKKTIIFGLAALMLIGIVAAGMPVMGHMLGMDTAGNDAVRTAIEDKDFGAWKEAVTATLTEENFNAIIERHIVMSKRMQMNQDIRDAIDLGDYDAYKAAAKDAANSEILTEEEFTKLTEMHEARQNDNISDDWPKDNIPPMNGQRGSFRRRG